MKLNSSALFKDFAYKRPDMKSFEDHFDKILNEFENASSAKQQFDLLREANLLREDFETMRTISTIRYTVNTIDKFYDEEHNFFDNTGPLYSGMKVKLYKVLLNSKFKQELIQFTRKELFDVAELSIKSFSPGIIEDMKVENQLVTKYQKLIASAKIDFEGEERNIAGMSPFMQSGNREVRKNANEAKWKFFEDNEKEFDSIYDEMVRVRTKMAKKLGYENFVQLAYDRLGRSGYTYKEVAEFRQSVKDHIVPALNFLKEMKKKRIGLEKLYYYDGDYNFKDGNPVPKGSPEWIVEKARKMYHELSGETGVFIDLMIDHELMDLYNRKGKTAGGYCSYIASHKSPFIFSNMNGTSDDVRVLTHEAGHAFQVYESRNFEIPEYIHPTLDACEIHSMSMEFITWPWMQLYFEEDTDKFLFSHLSRSLSFIPYGVTVDEFQHFVYENPDATIEDRKKMWRQIEEKYNPGIDYERNSFLENGGFWFHQGHIFKRPFYYVDYCLAEVCALQFWRKCNHDRDVAWDDYLRLCKAGGSKPFLELLKVARIESPFDNKVVKSIVDYVSEWLVNVNKEFELQDV